MIDFFVYTSFGRSVNGSMSSPQGWFPASILLGVMEADAEYKVIGNNEIPQQKGKLLSDG